MNDEKTVKELIRDLHKVREAIYGIDKLDFGFYQEMILIITRQLERDVKYL